MQAHRFLEEKQSIEAKQTEKLIGQCHRFACSHVLVLEAKWSGPILRWQNATLTWLINAKWYGPYFKGPCSSRNSQSRNDREARI